MRFIKAWVLCLGLAVSSAALAGEMEGGGLLADVDFDAGTVTIHEQVFAVTSASELRDRINEPLTLLELEHELGEWVLYKGIDRRPMPVLDVLQLSPLDGEE